MRQKFEMQVNHLTNCVVYAVHIQTVAVRLRDTFGYFYGSLISGACILYLRKLKN